MPELEAETWTRRMTTFQTFWSFARAAVSLGIVVGTITWGVMVWALDERYAPLEIVAVVESNSQAAARVERKVDDLSSLTEKKFRELEARQIDSRIFEWLLQVCSPETPPSTKQILVRRIRESSAEYHELTGNGPPEQTCDGLR